MSHTDELRPVDAAQVKARALAAGFDVCGIAPASAHPELALLRDWLDRGYAGEMHYLERSADRRMDIRLVLPSARSIIVLGTIYNVDRPYSVDVDDPTRTPIARYAWGDDYHDVIQHRMNALVDWLKSAAGPAFEARAYVDTGPVQERIYAQYAGVGWIGKNGCVINEEHGSWLFLSEIICNLPLPPDAPAVDQCGGCTLCLHSCPTGALIEPRVLDSTRCISYLTIEVRQGIPVDKRESIGVHAYGCDICQEVCPWNMTAPAGTSADPAWLPRAVLDGAGLRELWEKTDDELRAAMKGSAMRRAGVRRLRRNLAVAIGNSGDRAAGQSLLAHREPTCGDPMVAEHVAWAAARLGLRTSNERDEEAS